MNAKTHTGSFLDDLIYSIISIVKPSTSMHVRISDKGRIILNDSELASKLMDTIIENQEKLKQGQEIKVDEEALTVKFVTSMKEVKATEEDRTTN